MATAKTTIKPYKLKPSTGDTLTRDDLATWREVLLSHMRQNDKWKPFLPDGDKKEWKAGDDPAGNDWTPDIKAAFSDFLTCLSTFSPVGFGETVKRESTSFNWVIDLIKDTFNLKTRGEHFLCLDDIKFDFSGGFTYQQAFMELKDFVCAGLLSETNRFEGKPLTANETLSPVAKNFLTKEWLMKIDPRLPRHIKDTRGHLFTNDKPTLSCNQKVLCDQMPTLLAELDGKAEVSVDNVNIGYVPAPAPRRGYPQARGRGLVRGAGMMRGGYYQPPRALAPVRPQFRSGCQRCLEAVPARTDAAKTHSTKDCIWPPNTPQQFQSRPNFRVVLVPEEECQDYYNDQVFSSQFYDEANIEDVTYADNSNKESEFYPSIPFSNEIKINALPVRKVQTLSTKVNDIVTTLTLDSGAEGNCMKLETCQKLNLPIRKLDNDDSSVPTQADGKSKLDIIGQTDFVAVKNNVQLHWSGYVAKTLGADILCGGPFMERNRIIQDLSNKRVIVGDKYHFLEDSPFIPSNPMISTLKSNDTDNPTAMINIGPDVPKRIYEKLKAIHVYHQNTFNGDLTAGYNGASGNFNVDFNFKGDVPPPPNYDSSPTYFSSQDRDLLQAKIYELEDKGICIKVSDCNIVPKYAAPCMLVKKHSARDLKQGEYEKLPVNEKLKHNRFILCHNKLSDYIEKKPAKMNKLDDVVRTVGQFEYVITSDLSDSFWQRHIAKDKLPYFAFHSPFAGPYIFLRSTQGLINQSEELEQLVSFILKDCIMSGWCCVMADNIYVMGHNYDETVQHWQQVLELLATNNIKLSPKKTACFPKKLDLLGWTKEGKFLVPDPHRQNVIANSPLPVSVKDLRSYLGAYRTFFRCKKEMSNILKDLEEFASNRKSSEKLVWTPELQKTFEDSKHQILNLDKLYLPKPDDQLVMTSDWSEKGISSTLWAIIENDPKVVSRFSARLESSMEKMLNSDAVKPKTIPCDGEMQAVYIGIKSPVISANIRASTKKTVCLVDSKPVVEASRLIKEGKFSSSRIINNLMTALSDYDLEFQHLSAKMNYNIIDDFGSRNPASCQNNPDCKICNFIRDCDKLTIAPLSFGTSENSIFGVVKYSDNLIQDILKGNISVPFNNRKALKYLQEQDPDLIKVRDFLTSGKRPGNKHTKIRNVKRYLRKNPSIAKDGCLVVNNRDRHLNNRELILIPDEISVGLIYALHLNLNHPTPFQLSKILDTRFSLLDRDSKVQEVTDSCALCCSVSKIPKEIENFKPNLMPNHPGKSFTVDVLKMNRKNIMVTVENFSGFITTAFIKSENSDDLLEGIISTTTPLRSSITISIRVDQAPGFKSLLRQESNLKDLNICLELGDAKNKNAVALVDKKIKELEDEIRKLTTNGNVNLKVLSKATTVVNEKIRHQGLSAREIMFSRDQFSQSNLPLDDDILAQDKMIKRQVGNEYSAKSKAQIKSPATSANAVKGHIVMLKHEIDKHSKRDLYLVLDSDFSTQTLMITKLPNALSGNIPVRFQPHNITYKVKQTDIILAPNQPSNFVYESDELYYFDESDFDEDEQNHNEFPTPFYPYENEDDDYEEEYILEEEYVNHSDTSSSTFDSANSDDYDAVADDEATGDNVSNASTTSLESDHEIMLQENLEHREAEINDLIEDQVNAIDGAAALPIAEDEIVLDQSKQPKRGDIVTFVYGEMWVIGKILHKAKSSPHYNVQLMDGVKINVKLRPPTEEYHDSWSLLPPDEWRPEELRDVYNKTISRNASPILDVQRDSNPSTPHSLQLQLEPEELIQYTQVYYLPPFVQQPSQEKDSISSKLKGLFNKKKK